MKLSKREIVLSCFLGIMAVTYLFNSFSLLPLKEKAERLRDENQALQAKIQQEEKLIRDQNYLSSSCDWLQGERHKMEIAIPSSPCVPEILSFLHNRAGENGVNIISLRYLQLGSVRKSGETGPSPKGEGKLQELDLRITAKGSYPSLLNFISAIEESPRVFVIKQCKMYVKRVQMADEAVGQVESQQEESIEQNETEQVGTLAAPSVQMVQNSAAYEVENIVLNLVVSSFFDERPLSLDSEQGEDEKNSQLKGERNPFVR
ncbi:MAG: hypothetical protein PHP26_11375 [Syntrophomonas sp.]|uniref:hypothetical protein n=1 Tax=Syntrophomonas sp. TaxID=2053627 RepID=UPI00261D3523|nr:hypothetical protein [Syntrophomonas sp.]MDD2510231.1 hypothetical protein [Syntrophomonas sp.]MDD3880569.1 hypothetical protein [Syntrophomonas sp.]MDD4627170.1 hypothetical protein [Syntrophomonas sp.]